MVSHLGLGKTGTVGQREPGAGPHYQGTGSLIELRGVIRKELVEHGQLEA